MPFEGRALHTRGQEKPRTSTDLPDFEMPGFTGYTDLDGKLSTGSVQEAQRQFEALRGFSSVKEEEPVVQKAASQKSPETQKVEPIVLDEDTILAQQKALEMPRDLSEEMLLQALEAKLEEFKVYFDQKWKGQNLFQTHAAKDADLECLATLQGRITAQRRTTRNVVAHTEQEKKRQEELERIAQVELAQIRGDVLLAQGKLLAEWNGAPITAVYQRRRIYNQMKRLGSLLKPENELALRAWWNEGAYISEDFFSENDKDGFSYV
jgi:hypothetical protein